MNSHHPKAVLLAIPIVAAAAISLRARAQESAKPAAPADQPAAAPVVKKPPSRAELETEFKDSLTGAVFTGTWQMTGKGGLSGSDPLTDPKPDKYSISSAVKLNDDTWVVSARIEFGDKDVTLPVPVRVVWAEDTAIITVSDLALPVLGTYSARVMVHKGFYTGVWYCGTKNYGGVMSGRILKEQDVAKEPARDPAVKDAAKEPAIEPGATAPKGGAPAQQRG